MVAADGDGDGAVTRAEFAALYRRRGRGGGEGGSFWEGLWAPAVAEDEDFTLLDADGSGSLDAYEMARLPHLRLSALISGLTYRLILAVDDDGDDAISVDELRGHADELWPASRAPPSLHHSEF